jgi:hypothetical protein
MLKKADTPYQVKVSSKNTQTLHIYSWQKVTFEAAHTGPSTGIPDVVIKKCRA